MGLEALDYYEDLVEDLDLVFDAILTSYMHKMLNLGKPFLIPTEYILKHASREDIERWWRIIRQVNHVPILLPQLNFDLRFEEKLLRRLNRILPKKYIYKLNKDIYLR